MVLLKKRDTRFPFAVVTHSPELDQDQVMIWISIENVSKA